MNEIQELKAELEKIKERNRRVEMDKAWETSWFRRILIAVLTYGVIVIFFFGADLPEPFANAVVPTVGFLLSTISVSFFKKIWVGRGNKCL